MAGYHHKGQLEVELDALDSAPAWKLTDPGQLRTRGPLLQLEAVSFAYPERPGPDPVETPAELSTSASSGAALTFEHRTNGALSRLTRGWESAEKRGH